MREPGLELRSASLAADAHDRESWAAGEIPVLSYYQPLQSKPTVAGGELAADLAHLDDPAAKDGVTKPPPIDGNTRASLSSDDDGGYFVAQARAYYRTGALPPAPA